MIPLPRTGLAVLALAALALLPPALAPAPHAAAAPAAADADDLLVVDCLLPGKVRKLGKRTTYVTPRRPVKTSASECEIRGGEYVAYDRASHATALKIWLPLANQGDPVAQNYVGEIYEKGLGVPPQHALAATWYRKAAEQGLASAQINLGQLYEQGLGVEKNMAEALRWYRQASGLSAANLQYVPSGDVAGELEALRREVEERRSETDALKRELEQIRRDYERTREELRRQRGEAEQGRRELERLRDELARQLAAAEKSNDRAEIERLRGELRRRDDELARRGAEVGRLGREIAANEDEAARLRQQIDRLNQTRIDPGQLAELKAEVARHRDESEALRSELAQARRQLESSQASLTRRQAELEAARRELESTRAELGRQIAKAEAEKNDREAERLRKQLAEREAELERRRAQVAELEADIAAAEQRTAALSREVSEPAPAAAPEKAELRTAGGPVIELIDPPIALTRGTPRVTTRTQGERLVVGRVASQGGLLTFLVNDREETVDANGLFRVPVRVSETPQLVTIVAIDKQGRRSAVEFELSSQQAKALASAAAPAPSAPISVPREAFGKYFALVIGNNAYRHLPPLKTAVNDAKAAARLLEERYGFETEVLLDASRYDILSALNQFREILTENDNLLIYYAGHGELDRVNQRGHWLPVDAEPNSSANWISNIAITDVLNAMTAKHVMVIADSCYSGSMTRAALASLEAGMSSEARTNWIKVMAEKRSRTVLTSGGLEPVLDSGGGDHSVFARALFDVLRENDEIVEAQRLYRDVAARVALAASSVQMEQVPEYAPIKYAGHESGEFFFVPKAN